MRHNAFNMRHPVRIKLSNNGLMNILPHLVLLKKSEFSFDLAQGHKYEVSNENQTHYSIAIDP